MMSSSSSSMFRRLGCCRDGVVLSRAALRPRHVDRADDVLSAARPDRRRAVCASARICSAIRCRAIPRSINQFVVEDAEGRKPVVGRDGADPAGFLRVAAPGLLVIGYRSNPSAVELTAEKFNQYLKEEGLDAVAALRARRNETGAKAHEIFSRCAKSLVLSGSPSEAQGDRRLGFHARARGRAESVRPPRRPGSSRSPDLREPSARGRAGRRHEPPEPRREADGAHGRDGRVRFRLRPGGMWLIKAVHMIPAPAGTNAEWASYWASLTFELRKPQGLAVTTTP